MKTIIYITNNILDEKIRDLCIKHLLTAAGDNPIISVSQQPINLGNNICVGRIGSSWLNIYIQQLVGLYAATTDTVAIAEHDCLYTAGHFAFEPPDLRTFFYNENNWLVQYNSKNHPEYNGMYSYLKKRMALSQLVCGREVLIESIEERIKLIDSGLRIMRRLGEPGAFPEAIVRGAQLAVNGSHEWLRPHLDDHLKKFRCRTFRTHDPNVDVRHDNNFTGARRGKNRRWTLEPWGTWDEVTHGVNI